MAEGPGGDVPRTAPRTAPTTRRAVSALLDQVFSEPAGEAAHAPGAPTDLQSVLADAVADLARRTTAARVCAFWARDGDAPLCAASHWSEDGTPTPPDLAAFAALRALARASDLGEAGLDAALGRYAQRAGLSAAVAVTPEGAPGDAPAPIVLALGGDDDPTGRVRPRTLAMLEDVSARLRGPLASQLAVARLSRLDEAVQRLDRRAALGELVSEVVHEVRNPLVSVKTFLQLLPSRLDDREFLDGFREVALDEVIRLERLIDTVLRHAAPVETVSAEGAPVAAALERVVRLLDHRAADQRVTFELDVADPGATVTLSPDALQQVVLNLVLNALSVSPEESSVRLRALARDTAAGRFVEIRIEDEGPGIPSGERSRIFDAFHTTRPNGVGGLGLAISRRLVEEAGGRLRAEDATSGGTAMRVELPAAERPRA